MKRSALVVFSAMLLISLGIMAALPSNSQDDILETWIKGTVQDNISKELLEGANVYIYNTLTGSDYMLVTDEQGYFEANVRVGGDYGIYCWMDDYNYNYTEVSVDQGSETEVEMFMDPVNKDTLVFGYVYDSETEEPLPGAWVNLEWIDYEDGRYITGTYTDEEGYYEFIVEPGNYTLGAYFNGYEPYQMRTSEYFYVESGEKKEFNIYLDRIQSGIAGYVTDQDGNPVADANVAIDFQFGRYNAWTDEEGYYEIRAPPGSYDLSVRADGYRPYNDEVGIREGEVTEYDIELDEAVILNLLQRIIQVILDLLGGI